MSKLQLTEKFKVRKAEEKVENGLQIFNNKEFGEVRFVELEGKQYAIGSDVAKALEYAIPHKAVRDHCKGVLTWNVPHPQSVNKLQEVLIIPEGDIYRLIVKAADQSRNKNIKDKATKFEAWIFDEVIPSIRKTGSYSTQNLSPAELFLQNAQLFMEQERKLKAIESRVEVLDDKIEVVSIRPEKDWRTQTTECLNEIAKKRGGEYREVRTESYDLLDERMRVDVHARLKNKKKRMAELGISKSSQNKVTILDVIEDDPKLIEGYISVVKDMYLSH